MFKILPATGCSQNALQEAMQDAFSDYSIPLRLSPRDFEVMMRQRGLDLPSSRIALVEGQIAAIWLTSVRGSKSYLISSGTRPAFRSQGMARALAQDCLSSLRNSGIRSFQTEVLRDNETAARLYLSLGMEKSRLLDCYQLPVGGPPVTALGSIKDVQWPDIAPRAPALRDWSPSWQNDDLSLEAIADRLFCVACFDGTTLTGFAAATPETGTVHQLAVRPNLRRHGIASALLRTVQTRLPGTALRFINLDHGDAAFRAFLTHLGAVETAGQYELKLSFR